MKKDGFVFIESVVVLVVVALSLAMLISSYSLVTRKTKEKEYYDKASDKYLLYSLSNIGTDDLCNYGIDCSDRLNDVVLSTYRSNTNRISFRADKTDQDGYMCTKTKIGSIIYHCDQVFDELGLVHLYVVTNILEELNAPDSITYFDNGTIEYMKSLKKCNDLDFNKNSTTCSDPVMYLIGVFERGNDEYHYASIEIGSVYGESSNIENIPDGWFRYNKGIDVDLDQQIWYYYKDKKPLKGLQLLSSSSERPNSKYYYFSNNGVMQMGWVLYDGDYHLYSPLDLNSNSVVDGHRVQSCDVNNRTKITITTDSGDKDFYLNSQGACFTCQTGDCECTASDVGDKIVNFPSGAYYNCTGN